MLYRQNFGRVYNMIGVVKIESIYIDGLPLYKPSSNRAPLANLELWDYRGKFELWGYTLFGIGITEISFEIGVMDLKSNQIWIFHPCKLGLRDFTLFEIRSMGLHQF